MANAPERTLVPSRSHSLSVILATASSRALGLLLALCTVLLVLDRPFARLLVAVVLAACFILQLRFSAAWVLYLPALLPVFDLTPWTGRLYINEFDLLVLTTASAHFLQAPPGHQFPKFAGFGGVIIVLLLASFLVSTIIGALPLPFPDQYQFTSYLSHYNALRVAKSIGWAVLLLPALQRQLAFDSRKASTLFILGTSVGLMFEGLVVLWERGVFLALSQAHGLAGLYASRYEIIGALLDFGTTYRATSTFSELHTGGEAFDTYLALAPAVAAAGALTLRKPALRLLCLVAFGLGIYAVVASYSRGAYIACAGAMIAIVTSEICGFRPRLGGRCASLRIALATIVTLAILVLAYAHGGYGALLIGEATCGTGLAAALFLGPRRMLFGSLISLLAAFAAFALAHAFRADRYAPMDPVTAFELGGVIALALVVAVSLLGGRTIPPDLRVGAAVFFVGLSIFSTIAIPAIGGYRMLDRFSTVYHDEQTRWRHWADALRLMGHNWTDYVFGMGLGSFPRLWFIEADLPETKATYSIVNHDGETWLALGGGDFDIEQKVPVRPDTDYELSLKTRADNDAKWPLLASICPKFILWNDRYLPGCKVLKILIRASAGWTDQTISFNSGKLGADVPFYFPPTLIFYNDPQNPVVNITGVRLSDGAHNIVANGNFAAAMDRWIMVSDFEHLAWHIKSVYAEVFFETGAVGLSLLLAALVTAFLRASKEAKRREPIGLAAQSALVGFMVVGVVGSAFDNPRPALLFFIVAFWMLQPSPLVPRAASGADGLPPTGN